MIKTFKTIDTQIQAMTFNDFVKFGEITSQKKAFTPEHSFTFGHYSAKFVGQRQYELTGLGNFHTIKEGFVVIIKQNTEVFVMNSEAFDHIFAKMD